MEKRLFRDSRSFKVFRGFSWIVFAAVCFQFSSPSAMAAKETAEEAAAESSVPLAIKGYDPVAYFREGRPVRGKKTFEYERGTERWLFVSEENKLKFIEYPEKYLPRYGGYSVLEVGEGQKVQADPKIWSVIDGKLYLHKNLSSQDKWEKEQKENIERADYQWPRIR